MIPYFQVLNEWIGIFDLPINLKWALAGYFERLLNRLLNNGFLRIFFWLQSECVQYTEFE